MTTPSPRLAAKMPVGPCFGKQAVADRIAVSLASRNGAAAFSGTDAQVRRTRGALPATGVTEVRLAGCADRGRVISLKTAANLNNANVLL